MMSIEPSLPSPSCGRGVHSCLLPFWTSTHVRVSRRRSNIDRGQDLINGGKRLLDRGPDADSGVKHAQPQGCILKHRKVVSHLESQSLGEHSTSHSFPNADNT